MILHIDGDDVVNCRLMENTPMLNIFESIFPTEISYYNRSNVHSSDIIHRDAFPQYEHGIRILATNNKEEINATNQPFMATTMDYYLYWILIGCPEPQLHEEYCIDHKFLSNQTVISILLY